MPKGEARVTNGVLYVDDEPAKWHYFRKCFDGRFPIWIADGWRQGIEVLCREPVGVLLADRRLPGIEGRLLPLAREKWPSVRRIVLGTYMDEIDGLLLVESGLAARHLIMPWSSAMLREILDSSLEIHRLQARIAELEDQTGEPLAA